MNTFDLLKCKFTFYFSPIFYISTESLSYSVREMQPDVRELNQAELPEVDPEENSAEFMGILIKVGTKEVLSMLCSICPMFYATFILFWAYGKPFTYFVVILCQALAKLKKIPETIKAIMERLEPELKQIVKRSTTQIADHAYQRGESLAQESQPRYRTQQGRASPVLVGRIQAGFSILQEDTLLSPEVSLLLVKAVSAW